ncbi:MAG: sigma-70 family RNA polymerase sigma factor [Candidatus Dormibacteraeota bacterium]|nr:sigma-70 family RNA polymerase sigma factor [Candidatus Dormibacteraeota bacterium]MDQ6884886.1 sigma-70 family RNA polymerase sigma factor [Candidatus Dormibacteraeota bacterium]
MAVTAPPDLAEVFREEAGRVTTALIRRFHNFDLAEECMQEALVAAIETWPREGLPERPGAWLVTVASRRALNRIDREKRYADKLAQLAVEPRSAEEDDRLRLIMTCCHPALSREAQVALTLRAVCGFTTSQIARAFLASESTVAQRLVRAKRKIAMAGIPYRVPPESELPERLNEVLAVLYLVFNEGHLSTGGSAPSQRDLAEDAAWLAALLHRLLPDQPEVLGLLALMKLHLARGAERFTPDGTLVLLADQDRSRWNRRQIAEAVALIERAASRLQPGPYQLEAAIAACHAEAATFEATDWRQIVVLYDLLLVLAPSPVVQLNRAIALWKIEGPVPALRILEEIAGDLDGYHLFHAARGRLLTQLDRNEEARAAEARALALTGNPAERSLLRHRLFGEQPTTGTPGRASRSRRRR